MLLNFYGNSKHTFFLAIQNRISKLLQTMTIHHNAFPRVLVAIFALLIALHTTLAFAHKASDAFLTLDIDNKNNTGHLELALRDLEMAIGLDENQDGNITWRELTSKREIIGQYINKRIQFKSNNTLCSIIPTEYLVDNHSDGSYLVYYFILNCQSLINLLIIDYQILFDLDPLHRGLMLLKTPNYQQSSVFSPTEYSQQFKLSSQNDSDSFFKYFQVGMSHIWTGYDHMLFLLCLLLPSVLTLKQRQWTPALSFRPVFIEVLQIVSAFTIAHSITLSLTTFNVIQLPSKLVESGIAGSIIIAAINNLTVFMQKYRWLVAFTFGLLHGMGFASVLIDLNLPSDRLWLALLAFNLGVEFGQLVVVSIFLPMSYLLRFSIWYKRLVLNTGSTVIAGLAFIWLVERLFNLKLIGL